MVYKIKKQKRIAKDYGKGLDYKFVAFKYGVSQPDVFLAYEREQKLKKLRSLSRKFK